MDTGAGKKKVFIAATLEAVQRIRAGLEEHYAVTIATSMAGIHWPTIAEMDLVMCNLHFDEGHMFEFLQRVKSDPATLAIPFLCINSTGALSPALLHSVESASKAKGAAAFANVYAWRIAYGNDDAFGRLRHLIDTLIRHDDSPPADKAPPQQDPETDRPH